jgi:hypothetical protein
VASLGRHLGGGLVRQRLDGDVVDDHVHFPGGDAVDTGVPPETYNKRIALRRGVPSAPARVRSQMRRGESARP